MHLQSIKIFLHKIISASIIISEWQCCCETKQNQTKKKNNNEKRKPNQKLFFLLFSVRRQKDDMQVNVAGIRRNIKNLAHNYSDPQVNERLLLQQHIFLHFIFQFINCAYHVCTSMHKHM